MLVSLFTISHHHASISMFLTCCAVWQSAGDSGLDRDSFEDMTVDMMVNQVLHMLYSH